MNAKLTAQAHMLPTYEIVNDLKMLKNPPLCKKYIMYALIMIT